MIPGLDVIIFIVLVGILSLPFLPESSGFDVGCGCLAWVILLFVFGGVFGLWTYKDYLLEMLCLVITFLISFCVFPGLLCFACNKFDGHVSKEVVFVSICACITNWSIIQTIVFGCAVCRGFLYTLIIGFSYKVLCLYVLCCLMKLLLSLKKKKLIL